MKSGWHSPPRVARGRFACDAVAVDPRTGNMYLTEDAANPNGLLYRWEAPDRFRTRRGELNRLLASRTAE